MRFGRIAAFCAASVLTGTLAAPAFAQSPYDGNWQVVIVTKSGKYGPFAACTNYPGCRYQPPKPAYRRPRARPSAPRR